SKELWGATFPTTLSLQAQLVSFYRNAGMLPEAERTFGEYLESRRAATIKPSLMFCAAEGMMHQAMKDWMDDHPEKGREALLFLIGDVGAVINPQSKEYTQLVAEVSSWMADKGFDRDAEPLYEQYAGILRKKEPLQSADLATALVQLGAVRT